MISDVIIWLEVGRVWKRLGADATVIVEFLRNTGGAGINDEFA